MTVKSDNPHSTLWLSFALKSFAIREQIQKIASGTSGSMKNISKKDFLELEIINPPYKLQKTFEDALKKINELKRSADVNLGKILFNSLIQKAFNGVLVS
jgi:type I restriction enzyme S subunit